MTMVLAVTVPGFAMLMTDRRLHTQSSDGTSQYRDGPPKLRHTRDGWVAPGGLLEVGERALRDAPQMSGADPSLPDQLTAQHATYCDARPRLAADLGRTLDSSFAFVYAADGGMHLLTVDCAARRFTRKAGGCYAGWPTDLASTDRAGILRQLQRGTAAASSAADFVRLAASAFLQVEVLSRCVSKVVDLGVIVQTEEGPLSVGLNGPADNFFHMTDRHFTAAVGRLPVGATFMDTRPGDTWEVVRFVNGVEDTETPPGGPVPVSQSFIDHEVPGWDATGGSGYPVSYRAYLVRGGQTVDSRDSSTVTQFLTSCGP